MAERHSIRRPGTISPFHSGDLRVPSAGATLAGSLAFLLFAVPLLAASDAVSGTHIIQGPNVGRISDTGVTITWVTDKAKAGKVTWGKKKAQHSHKAKETVASAHHTVTLTGLAQDTTYHILDDRIHVDGVAQWLDGDSGSTGVGNGRWTLGSIDHDTATAQLLDENGNVTYTRVIASSQP